MRVPWLHLNTHSIALRLGKGAVFSYDPVGNFEREAWRSAGSASHLIQPFLDNQVRFRVFVYWALLRTQHRL